MAIPAVQGGHVFTDATLASAISVTRWTASWTARLGEVTTSGSLAAAIAVEPTATVGGSQYAGVVQDNSATCDFPLDDPAFPETLGFTPGLIIETMFFKHGASTKADKLVLTTVESVEKHYDAAGDVERVTVRVKGGTVIPNFAAPTT
jgi:hypothetical protein